MEKKMKMAKKALFKKLIISCLTLTMILGGSTSVLADGKSKGHDQGKNNGKGKIEVKWEFKDVGDGYGWARGHIANLALKKVFDGYADGNFKPEKSITRLEAIIAAVRLMGLREEAETQAKMNTKLNFKDNDIIKKKYPQAVGYVAVAVENDLFTESEMMVQPEKAADRLWATILLVKALKLEQQAKAKMNTKLGFKDSREIPAGSVGYVALAVEKGLIYGYENNTFRPNKPVTRAELAALLDRTGEQMPDYDTHTVKGTIGTLVSNNVLTMINEKGQTEKLTIASNAYILRNGIQVNASALQVGDQVIVHKLSKAAILIVVTQSNETNVSFNGTVGAVINDSNVIWIMKDGLSAQYTVQENANIYVNELKTSAKAVQVGDKVLVRTQNNKIVHLQVTERTNAGTDFNGTVSEIINSTVLSVTRNAHTAQYALDPKVDIYRNEVKVNASALKQGDEVFVRMFNNAVVFVHVTQKVEEREFTVNGLFKSVKHNSDGKISGITIYRIVDGSTQETHYEVSAALVIKGDASLLVLHRPVELKASNGIVTLIEVK